MFKISFIIAICLGTCLSGHITAQETEFSVLIDPATDEYSANGKIALTITRGNPDYTAYLFDKAPWKGGTEIQKLEPASDPLIEFNNLLPGDYYIIVEDKDRNPGAKAVNVGILPN
jgi:hypothetical protein